MLKSLYFRLFTSLLILTSSSIMAEQIPVRYKEGTVHGFLVLRTEEGKLLASGDLIQTIRGDRLQTEVVFHFEDGSIDDEVTIFSQRGHFRLISNHHVQKGPAFPHPMDVTIDASRGEVQVRSTEDGKDTSQKQHLDLPPDLANGLVLILLKNFRPDTPEAKLSYLAITPQPRLVKLAITSRGEETFTTAGSPRRATHYEVKVDLGGIAGVIAPLIGKQPQDVHVWILGGKAPAFVKMEGPLSRDAPNWTVELTSPTWKKAQPSEH